MAIVGQRRKRYRKHDFLLNIENITRAGFKTCSELKVTIENIQHREGTDLEPENLPGNVTTEPLTLTWGTSDDLEFWEWFKQAYNSRKQGGLSDDQVFRSGEVQQLNRDNSVALVYGWEEGYPGEISFGDWDKDANELSLRSVLMHIRGVQDPTRG